MSMKSYNLKIQVRNNHLLSVMRTHGIATVAELSRLTGVHQSTIGDFMNLAVSGTNPDGSWKRPLVRIADFLRVTPDMLIPPQHLDQPLAKNRAEVEVSLDEACQLAGGTVEQLSATPFDSVVHAERDECLSDMLQRLTIREEQVIEHRFGLSGKAMTYDEIGRQFRLSRERIRQIEQTALGKLRGMARKGPDAERIRTVLVDLPTDSASACRSLTTLRPEA